MNWSFVFLAQHEDPEGGSVLLESSIDKIVLTTWSKKIPECRNGKSRAKKNASHATFAVIFAPFTSRAIRRQSSGTAMVVVAKTVE